MDHRDPCGARCARKLAATGIGDMTPSGVVSRFWQLVLRGPPWLVPLHCLTQQALKGQPWFALFFYAAASAGVWGERDYSGAPPPACDSAVLPCFSDQLFSSKSIPCGRFLPSHSFRHLLTVNSSLPRGCSPIPMLQLLIPMNTSGPMYLSGP